MIFCGDIALPYVNGVIINGFPDDVTSSTWVGNLEGSLCAKDEIGNALQQRMVFNNLEAVKKLCKQLSFKCFCLANNHLKDAASVNVTLKIIDDLGINSVGAGVNIRDAKKEIVFSDYVIVAFGWKGIGCRLASEERDGVNSYDKWSVISQVENLLSWYPDKKLICLMHWNYELELYPQPLDRELSHRLIDMGVEAVIGCHAHRVQPIELYKGHPIVYGLGNFAFRQGVYMGGNLRFPECSYDEIAFEITKESSYIVHHLRYNPENYSVEYVKACEVENASFADMNEREYAKFFKKNRIQKKLLPIFYYNDSRYKYQAKIAFVVVRQIIINLLVQNKAFFRAVKSLASKIS